MTELVLIPAVDARLLVDGEVLLLRVLDLRLDLLLNVLALHVAQALLLNERGPILIT